MKIETEKFVFKGNVTDNEYKKYGIVKCKKCGFVGFHDDLPIEPIIRKKDWVVSLIFLPIGGMGLVNLVITYFQRAVKVRYRQCPICDSVFDLKKMYKK